MIKYLRKRVRSFAYAFEGIEALIKGTANARIHVVAALVAIALSVLLKISIMEWVAVIIVIGMVIAIEAVNTAVEDIADLISNDKNHNIKKIKDIAAGAVLVAAISAFAVGIIIFAPKIIHILHELK